MFTFLTTVTQEDVRRAVERLSSGVKTESPLSPRSREIIKSVRFTREEMKRAGAIAMMKIAAGIK